MTANGVKKKITKVEETGSLDISHGRGWKHFDKQTVEEEILL